MFSNDPEILGSERYTFATDPNSFSFGVNEFIEARIKMWTNAGMEDAAKAWHHVLEAEAKALDHYRKEEIPF